MKKQLLTGVVCIFVGWAAGQVVEAFWPTLGIWDWQRACRASPEEAPYTLTPLPTAKGAK